MLTLKKASLQDSEKIHNMQIIAFKAQLDRYQDFEISPGAEPLERFRARFDNANIGHYLIQLDGENIGYVRVSPVEDKTYKLSTLFILPSHRGKGYAQQAITQAEKLYPRASKWMLNTIKQEPSLCYLYEKMGYTAAGEFNIKADMDLIHYEKQQ